MRGHMYFDGTDLPVMMAAAEVQEGTMGPIGNVQARSDGGATPVGYSVTGGANMSLFSIVAGTGELTMTSNAGAAGATYEVEVTYTDSNGSDKVLIEVTSVNTAVSSGTIFVLR